MLNAVLQWLAVVGAALGLLASIGLIAVRKESANRQGLRLAEAHRTTAALQERLKPRHLSEDQKASLSTALSTGPNGVITVMASKMDNEATDYSVEIMQMLTDTGFTAKPYSGPLILSMTPGVWIQVRSLEQAPPHAILLANALNTAGIRCATSANADIPVDEALLAIGPKE